MTSSTTVPAAAPTPIPQLVSAPAELSAVTAELLGRAGRAGGQGAPSLGLVPTMGGLHGGHASLVRTAREANDVVVASIFVNPLQFGDATDLERYPRALDADLQLLAVAGADVVFVPGLEEMYPGGEPLVRISAGRMGELLEGAARPGHFDGMLTVVAKLLNLGMPAVAAQYRAYFGEKDAQQLALIRRMVLDLNVPVHIEGVPIVRDDDGLALSSRNRFLLPNERSSALVLPRTLDALRQSAERGELLDLRAARARISGETGVELDYLELVDPLSFLSLTPDAAGSRPSLAVVAAKVGSVRLIDNTLLPSTAG